MPAEFQDAIDAVRRAEQQWLTIAREGLTLDNTRRLQVLLDDARGLLQHLACLDVADRLRLVEALSFQVELYRDVQPPASCVGQFASAATPEACRAGGRNPILLPLTDWWPLPDVTKLPDLIDAEAYVNRRPPRWQSIITGIETPGIEAGRQVDPPPLSKVAALVYEMLCELPVHKAMLGREIVEELHKKHDCLIDESTLTRRIIPELKPYGIENKPRVGYRIRSSERPPPESA